MLQTVSALLKIEHFGEFRSLMSMSTTTQSQTYEYVVITNCTIQTDTVWALAHTMQVVDP